MSEPIYALVCGKTNLIKTDAGTGMFCIFDTLEKAKGVKSSYVSKEDINIVKCTVNFTDKEIL